MPHQPSSGSVRYHGERSVNIVWTRLLLACTEPKTFQTIDITGNEYAIIDRSIDTLFDPASMRGELGNLYVGGIFQMDWSTGALLYENGRPLQVQYQTVNGSAHPVDRDGLIAFSYYAHLEDTVSFLESTEHNWDGLLPIDTAISPII